MLRYPVKLSRDTNDTILVEFPDFPEATPSVRTKVRRSCTPWTRLKRR